MGKDKAPAKRALCERFAAQQPVPLNGLAIVPPWQRTQRRVWADQQCPAIHQCQLSKTVGGVVTPADARALLVQWMLRGASVQNGRLVGGATEGGGPDAVHVTPVAMRGECISWRPRAGGTAPMALIARICSIVSRHGQRSETGTHRSKDVACNGSNAVTGREINSSERRTVYA